ncbi:hypothetical protein M0R88_01375 [Halorussus gelatinilyticus]|uniref:Uncharacterized protein n=1 Tax=Halorussus gelatinilyticus TaxID=2937524 RepID=A0A8U0IIZ1_9EURY|nr:hypothetical protein [Halorussus gelatinilyticus]UPW00768.1 hypothetical protein M0R88_01375 [Halorussus gelatinilyticus]
MNQIRVRLDETGARTALVRGANAPARPPDTVTVAPGVSRTVGPEGGTAPLFVTGEAPSGRTVREYDGREPRAAADHATGLVADRDPRAAWLCGRDRIRAWCGRGVAAMLERRLCEAARDADARLVVWTNDYEPTSAGRDPTSGDCDPTGADEESVAVEDRYDVVLDP